MALNINGTTGISGVDGSASAPALTGTDSNTGINFASDTVNINTGGVTRATGDSPGNVSLGTTSNNSERLRVQNNATTSTSCQLSVISGNAERAILNFGDADDHNIGRISYNNSDNSLFFHTNNTERMRIDSSGNLLKNTTSTISTGSASDLGIQLGANNQAIFIASGGPAVLIARQNATGEAVRFGNQGASDVGSIDVTTSSTSYTTSSDYRLKENVVAISDGITRLKTLKPSRFNFKVDKDTTVDGFLAHEVTAVPEAITGTKDEVDSDDNPVYQGIDQSKLVPLLTAALQEAVAKIEVLETKVAALEAG